ncbi:MAG: DNA polymerase/3'-5' exonuclease PolX [Chloroflexota bacterium]
MQPAAPRSDSADRKTNREVAQFLDRIAMLLEARGESPFRVRAYREAAAHIEAMSQGLVALWKAGALQTITGVGPSIAAKVDEWLRTGHSAYLDELQRSVPVGIEQLMSIPGIGPSRARALIKHLNVHTPEELAIAAENHALQQLPGFGARSEERILVEARRWSQREKRLLLGVAWPIAERVIDLLRTNPIFRQVSAAGSLRRMRETIGDIDLLAASDTPAAAVDAFARLPIIREVLARGPTKASVLLESGLQVDLRVVEPGSWGAALQYFTGSKLHSITLRDIAIGMGLKLNEYGVYREATGRRVGGETEADVYHALGMEWIPPELREDRGEIQAAETHRLPVLVERADLTGDLHVHSSWSDGTAGIEAMAVAARAVGLSYIAITDHSPSLSIANGLTPERLQQQRQEIDTLNARLAPFRIYQGSEVDIRPDGTLDLPDAVLARLDYVSVSVHSRFHMGSDDMTGRIIRAIRNPFVNTLNHPTGRLIDRRPGYDVDLEAVLRVAASQRVAVEINSQMQRLDLDDVWSRRAKELGCQLVVDSDAHGPAHYGVLRYGIAVARRGWLTSANVVNTLPRPAFDKWLQLRRGQRAA